MSGAAAHLIGAFLVFNLGLIMLLRGWGDCEDYDALSIIRGKEGESDQQRQSAMLSEDAGKWRRNRELVERGSQQILAFAQQGQLLN